MSLQNVERKSLGINEITTVTFKHEIADKNIVIGNM